MENPFYFLFSHPKISNEILTHYLYPPELWEECIRKAVLGRGSGGLIPPPPPPLLLPFPHLYHGLFFPVHNKQGLWEDVHVLLVRSEIFDILIFLPNPPLSLPLPWICLKQGQCLIWWKHQMFNEDLFADYSWESHGYQSSHLWTREAFWPVSSRWTLLALSKCDKTS